VPLDGFGDPEPAVFRVGRRSAARLLDTFPVGEDQLVEGIVADGPVESAVKEVVQFFLAFDIGDL